MKCWVKVVLVGAIVVGGVAAGPKGGKRATLQTMVDVEGLVKRLGSDSYAEREEAAGALVRAYQKYGGQIEAASKREGLEPQVALELQEIVAAQKPRAAARARADRLAAEDAENNERAALEAYEKVGKHDPKWDGPAREVIRLFTSIDPRSTNLVELGAKIQKAYKRAKEAGCDDPLVRYFAVRSRGQEAGTDYDALAAELKGVVDELEASDYPAQRKCWAHARYLELVLKSPPWETPANWGEVLGRELDLAIKNWAETVRDPLMTDSMAYNLAEVIEYDWMGLKGQDPNSGGRAKVCESLFIPWRAAMPKATGPWVFRGSLYVRYAWDARGDGWANTVTDDGWKQMVARLKVARDALERAYELDPADPRGPTEMLTVELGRDTGRVEMEKWWKRAMEANPDNYAACTSKLYYLEPKWHGSPADMIQFGRECLSAGNWEGRIPFVLVDAHATLAGYSGDRKAYFAQPGVWEDLRSVYEPYLARYPKSVWDRSYYAYYAAEAGQWAVARKQFEILGDRPEVKPFGTMAVYRYLREKAKEETAGKS